MKKKTFLTSSLSMIVSTILLASCGNAVDTTKAASSEASTKPTETAVVETSAASTEYPIVITHAFGETVIESKPVNIATIGWANHDTPLGLGVVPVGVSAGNYGLVDENKLHPWTAAAFEALGEKSPVVFDDVDGLDYEAISDVQPDVILASYSGITKEEYQLLTEIAPVVPYVTAPWQTYWRDQTIINATGMGMKKEGEAKVAEVEALIQEKISAYPELAGTKTVFCWISPDDFSTFYVYLPADPRAAYLTDLGLEFPKSVLDMAKNSSDFSVTLSRENADQLSDVDMMVVYGDQKLLEALQADELMSKIPAIKNGSVVLVDSTTALAGASTPSILSIPDQIDEYLELLSKAHGKIQ